MEITYFVHATTADNEAGLATGWIDCPLSEKGKRQALELRDVVANRFDIVISSDLKRAQETAGTAFAPLAVTTDRRLREIHYGDLAGQPSRAVKRNLLKYVSDPFPGGESYSDVAARMLDFLKELRETCAGKRVALVAHQAPQLALDVLLNKKTWEEAFRDDWRNTHAWQPGWVHDISGLAR